MLKAKALFAPLIALNFLFAWPCGAYTGSLPSPSAKERRPVITVGHHRYEDFDNDDDFDDPPPPRRADPTYRLRTRLHFQNSFHLRVLQIAANSDIGMANTAPTRASNRLISGPSGDGSLDVGSAG